MEPIGLAVGVIGLAGLFSTCLDAVDKIQTYRSFGTDSKDLQAQLTADRLRFEQWGRQVGFDNGKLSADHHSALDDSETSSAVEGLLLIVQRICSETDDAGPVGDKLSSKAHVQSSHRAPTESKRRKVTWSLWGKDERTEQIKLFGRLVQQLHNLVPPSEKNSLAVQGMHLTYRLVNSDALMLPYRSSL